MREWNRQRIAALIAGPVLSAGLLSGLAVPSAAQSGASDKALVESFLPRRILDAETDDRGQRGLPLSKRYGFVAVDLNGTGHPDFLVAVYVTSDAGSADLLVLKKTDGSAVQVGEFNLDCRGGSQPRVSLLDLEHTGTPEILVELGGRGQLTDWVFKWNGTTLNPFGPTEPYDDGRCTLLQDASFIDLDGAGILEIVNAPEYLPGEERSDAPRTYQLYRLVDGAYTLSGVFEYLSEFVPPGPSTKPPRTEGFNASAPGSSYIMTIANGARRDETPPVGKTWLPVQGAEIRLNGELVPGTEKINQTVRYLKIPVTVKARNTVDVKVAVSASAVASLSSMLTIGIGPAPSDSQSANSQK